MNGVSDAQNLFKQSAACPDSDDEHGQTQTTEGWCEGGGGGGGGDQAWQGPCLLVQQSAWQQKTWRGQRHLCLHAPPVQCQQH